MSRFKNFFARKVVIPANTQFIRSIRTTKHRQATGGDPVLIFHIEVGDEKINLAIEQGLAWQLVRQIRKEIGFSESELDAAQWIGRYSGGGNV
jgi:hypothetical protein